MDEIVWTINPKNDSLENLANYIFQYAQDYFQHSGVRCRLDVPARLPDLPCHAATDNLFMAIKEALNNVLNMRRDGGPHWTALTDSQLTVTIAMTGAGFRPTNRTLRRRLVNMKQRLERIGGG